jgi:hypothetical protein
LNDDGKVVRAHVFIQVPLEAVGPESAHQGDIRRAEASSRAVDTGSTPRVHTHEVAIQHPVFKHRAPIVSELDGIPDKRVGVEVPTNNHVPGDGKGRQIERSTNHAVSSAGRRGVHVTDGGPLTASNLNTEDGGLQTVLGSEVRRLVVRDVGTDEAKEPTAGKSARAVVPHCRIAREYWGPITRAEFGLLNKGDIHVKRNQSSLQLSRLRGDTISVPLKDADVRTRD